MKKSNFQLLRMIGIFCAFLTVSYAEEVDYQITSINPKNYDELRVEMEKFQGIIENSVAQNLKGTFPILGAPKGSYLEDFGVVFSLEANLYQIRPISPFSPKPHSRKELDEAYQSLLDRVDVLRKSMLLTIAENGTSLRQLRPTDNLAVIVHLFNGYTDPSRRYPSQLIIKIKMDSLSQYSQRKITLEQFSEKVHITHF